MRIHQRRQNNTHTMTGIASTALHVNRSTSVCVCVCILMTMMMLMMAVTMSVRSQLCKCAVGWLFTCDARYSQGVRFACVQPYYCSARARELFGDQTHTKRMRVANGELNMMLYGLLCCASLARWCFSSVSYPYNKITICQMNRVFFCGHV